ncbi:MAG: polysaccharide export protein [Syntrophobacteraceae bacterium]|nr:polysaccharide export protein [Syntrophobacteraceae bacterium]
MKQISIVIMMLPLVFSLVVTGLRENAFGEDYRIAPADILQISIYGEDALARDGLVVRPDGKISFPLIGDLEVAGLTTSEVKKIVEQKMRRLVPQANAAVIVSKLGSLQYYIVGKVEKPGMYDVSKSLTVLQLMALAGGPTIFAREKNIYILRNHGGSSEKLPFNYHEVKYGKHLEENIVLQRGDVVLVP